MIKRFICYVGLHLALCGVTPFTSHAAIANGSFDAGFSGFTTDYTVLAPGTDSVGGQFGIRTNPQTLHHLLSVFGDHTTGTGNMMVVDGSPTANSTVWQEVVTVAPGTTYSLSAWAATAYIANFPTLRFFVNGAQLGSDLPLPGPAGNWKNFAGLWNSDGSSTATIRIIDLNTSTSGGNDFGLDDLSFVAVPEPSSLGLLAFAAVSLIVWKRRRHS